MTKMLSQKNLKSVFLHFYVLGVFLIPFTPNSNGEEQIILKERRTKQFIAPGPITFFGETSEERDLVPGNDSFGFFYKPSDGKNGICRIRAKIVCDYGLALATPIKNVRILLIINTQMYSQVTDHQGILDALFRCPKEMAETKVTLTFAKYESSFVLKEAPGTHAIPDGKCK